MNDDTDGLTITVGELVLTVTEADIRRFDAKVDRSGGPERCWIWVAGRTRGGYGPIRLGGSARRMVMAHRLAYVIAHGSIDPELQVDHLCHHRECVSPSHLRLVTRAVNGANRSGAQANSRSGVRGVCWHAWGGRWCATAARDGRHYHGGYHDSLEAAERAAIMLRVELGIASLADPQRLAELTTSSGGVHVNRSDHEPAA